jgi:hypothetical protein
MRWYAACMMNSWRAGPNLSHIESAVTVPAWAMPDMLCEVGHYVNSHQSGRTHTGTRHEAAFTGGESLK